jgi:hypothetical protein
MTLTKLILNPRTGQDRTMTKGIGYMKVYEENDSKSSEQNYTRNYVFVCLLAMGIF